MTDELPVIMCCWQRPGRFPSTLEWLARQEGSRPHLFVFNNNWDAREELERSARQSSVPVSIKHSRENRGSIARFVWARQLYQGAPYLVFIDDDQVLDSEALAGLVEEAAPRSIVGVWAFRFNSVDSYWDREKAPPGEEADYVGTGGQILDSSIFAVPELYTVPPPHPQIEDLWLCHQARRRGWVLKRSAKVIWTPPDDDDLDQWHVLKREKDDLYQFLLRDGFEPLRLRGETGH